MIKEKKKILVLEDEKPLARVLELKLVHEGFDVVSEGDGENVILLIKKHKLDLIICDMLMPKFDGFHVLQVLKDNSIKIPVIVLTNLSQAEDEKRILDLGAAGFFTKADIPINTIVEKVKEMLNK